MTQTTAHSPARVLLLGNPNAGKSTLFAALTRSHAHIGNYPGLTVESRQALTRPGLGPPLSIVDVPGVYSLTPRSQDEVLTTAWALGARGRARAAA
ncbi:MAG: FeoB small GTPase domain-containing protein, partial [Polyangiales bacterium]